MTLSKAEFMNKPKIRKLPKAEQERRWKQHLENASQQVRTGARVNKRLSNRGYTPNTTLVIRNKIAEYHLSPCAQHYLLALQVPFSTKQVACVPDIHAIPSKKIRVKTRGTFSTGLDGNGYIVLNPWCNSSDGSQVGFTTAGLTSSSSVLAVFPPAVGTSNAPQPKIPYSNADFADAIPTPGVQARTVGVGLRIRYIGPELARSGQIAGIRHPDNETLVGLSYQDIKSYSTAKTYQNNRSWQYVMWRPSRPDEYHFSVNSCTPSDGINYTWSMGFIINGTTDTSGSPGPAAFEWETMRYVEYIGNIDNVTRSHVDLVGMSHIRNALPDKSTTDKPHHTFAHVLKQVEDSIGESLPAAAGGALAYKQMGLGAASAEEGIFSQIANAARSVASKVGEAAEAFIPELETGGEFLAPLLL